MERWRHAAAQWNARWGDLPRRCAFCAGLLLALGCLAALLPLWWPFALGLGLAMLMEPLVRPLRRWLRRLPGGASLAAALGLTALLGGAGTALWLLTRRVAAELAALAAQAPQALQALAGRLSAWAAALTQAPLSPALEEALAALAAQGGKALLSLASNLSAALASGAVSTAASLPKGLLALVFTLLSAFAFSSDREAVIAFFTRRMPPQAVDWLRRVRQGALRALGRQLKAQALVSLVVGAVVMGGLLLLGKAYALALGLLIGLADALPAVGAGLFLLPWSAADFLSGDSASGWGLLGLYGAVLLTRQIAEPRLVGKSLGLHPLAAMASMFAGLQLAGFPGLLLAPMAAHLCLAVLETTLGPSPAAQPPGPTRNRRPFPWQHRRK